METKNKNGVNEARVKAVLGGGQDRVNEYLVRAVMRLENERDRRETMSGFWVTCRANIAVVIAFFAGIGGLITAIIK
uniref:Uncharacterized protein n=1 Tax=viral metagenome TaxID=1070528 RepID=A0A6M3JQV5_9ZZZZ